MLTLATPRTDDVLAGVTVPVASGPGPAAGTVSHLAEIHAELVSRQYPAGTAGGSVPPPTRLPSGSASPPARPPSA